VNASAIKSSLRYKMRKKVRTSTNYRGVDGSEFFGPERPRTTPVALLTEVCRTDDRRTVQKKRHADLEIADRADISGCGGNYRGGGENLSADDTNACRVT
jgi:hypothetical protein